MGLNRHRSKHTNIGTCKDTKAQEDIDRHEA